MMPRREIPKNFHSVHPCYNRILPHLISTLIINSLHHVQPIALEVLAIHEQLSRTEASFAVLVLNPEIVAREWEEITWWIPGRHPPFGPRSVSSSSLTLVSFSQSLWIIMFYHLELVCPHLEG